jgi:hypothetical protein
MKTAYGKSLEDNEMNPLSNPMGATKSTRSAKDDAPKAVRSPLDSALGDMNNAIVELTDFINILSKKVEPLMKPDNREIPVSYDKENGICSSDSEVVEAVYGLTNRILSLAGRVDDINNRCQI